MLPAALLALLVTAPIVDSSATIGGGGATTVLRVDVVGARRTSPAFIRSALGIRPGDRFDPAAIPALEGRLLGRRIFREVRITPAPDADGVVLHVDVREKVTLVPIPFLGISQGVFTAGTAILDANLLGGGELAVVGGLGSNRGGNAFAFFRDPGVADTGWIVVALAGVIQTRRERYDGADLQYRYRERQLEAELTFGRRLDDHWTALAGWSERRNEARLSDGYAAPPRGGAVHGPVAVLELDDMDPRGDLPAGVSGRAEVKQGVRLARRERRTFQATVSASWSARVLGDHGLSLSARVDRVRGDAVLDAARLGGLTGSRGFRSQGLWAEAAASAALEYQVPFWRPRWGLLTAAGFCDGGWARWRERDTRYLAPGTGLRIYLRDVAIPVLGFDVAWATGVASPAFGVQLGLRR